MFRFFPVEFTDNYIYDDTEHREDVIVFEDAIVVEQPASVPPPPSPRNPEPRPDDEIVEDEFDMEFDFDDGELPDPDPGAGEAEGEQNIAENPSRPPNVRRIVEPSVSREFRGSDDIRIYVTFLVNREGRVEEVDIDEIRIFDEDEDDYIIVDQVNDALIEATLKAAYRWQFSPAEEEGQLVRARTRHVFTFRN